MKPFFPAIALTISLSLIGDASAFCYTRDPKSDPACVVLPKYNLSLCADDEEILFSCQIRGRKKTLSVCGTKEITKTTGYIQYRYGTKSKVELRYPDSLKPPFGLFVKTFSLLDNRYLSKNASVIFSIGQHKYVIFSEWINGSTDALNNDTTGQYGDHIGIRIFKQDKLINKMDCDGDQGLIGDPDDIDKNFPEFLNQR